MSTYNEIAARWTEPPTFDKTIPENVKPVTVVDGVMIIRNYDTDTRIQVIPLKNVEFIDRIWYYLTFHMKSGEKHTIYVGNPSKENNMDTLILENFSTYTRGQRCS